MKKDLLVFAIIFGAAFLVFSGAFLTFFAQDDFILITQFSGHGLIADLARAFGPPQVSHWRPAHNLFFLIGGDLFGKDFFWYHFLAFLIQGIAGFFIFKSLKYLGLGGTSALFSAILYVVSPSHFNTYYWISGGATAIGFCLFIVSFYLYIKKEEVTAGIIFITSLLASEAMLAGLGVFFAYDFFFRKKHLFSKTNLTFLTTYFDFLIVKIILTPKSTFDTYKISISPAVFGALKFYIFRGFSFPGVSGDQTITLILVVWVLVVSFLFINKLKKDTDLKTPSFFLLTFIFGLFPFIFIPDHLSANYMNFSIFAAGSFLGLALSKVKFRYSIVLVFVFILISIVSVKLIEKDNWVTKRAALASWYLDEVTKSNPPSNSTLIFNDNYISTSYDAYVSLGTGKAIDFWFPDKNYKTCFTAFEKCSNLN